MKGLVWWENIINAKNFIDSVVDAVKKRESVIMFLPENVPWEESMRRLLEERVQLAVSDKSINRIYELDEPVADYLFRTSCREELRVRHRGNVPYAEFIAQKEEATLHSRIVWAYNVSGQKVSEWVDFVSLYNQKLTTEISPGIFIVEVRDAEVVQSGTRNVRFVSYDEHITDYDVYSFTALLAAEAKCNNCYRKYIADLAAQVCGSDVEMAAECIRRWSDFLKDPYDTVVRICKNERRDDGAKYIDCFTADEVRRRVWKAQVRNIFPELENYRLRFIEKHKEIVESYKDEDETVELGKLYYLVMNQKLVVSYDEKENLRVYHEARNKLAHLGNITFSNVQKILGK